MKKLTSLLVFLFSAFVLSAPLQAKRVRTIHLASYNIQHGAGMDGKIDYARQARVVCKADVAAIQEVDSVTKRNGGLYSLEEIGRRDEVGVGNSMFAGDDGVVGPAVNFDAQFLQHRVYWRLSLRNSERERTREGFELEGEGWRPVEWGRATPR